MIDFLKVFDAYSLRARLFPAIIAAAPAFAAVSLLISWKSFQLSNVIATIALLVILFAITDFTRVLGRAIEPRLFAEQGGKPSITMFRRNDSTIDNAVKDRYRSFLASKLRVAAPTPAEERADQSAADSFYEQCGVWLRQNTRDTKAFSLLFGENVTYGFRRNLLGVKWLALGLNLVVVLITLLLLWRSDWTWDTDFGKRTIVVLLIAVIHAIYICAAVRKGSVQDASRAYARELILSCEALLRATPAIPKRRPSRRKTSSK